MAEGRMIHWREEKSEVMVAQPFRRLRWSEIDANAQRLEHIGAPGLGSDGAIAVFGHRHSGGRRNESDGSGDIESIQPVATRAANVKNLPRPHLRIEGR